MRPAGEDRRSPPKVKDGQSDVSDRRIVASDGLVVRGNNGVVPLSVEFSLKTVPKNLVPTGKGSDDSENCVPSLEIPEGVVGRSEAVVSNTAVAGAAPRRICWGGSSGRPCRDRCFGRCRDEIIGRCRGVFLGR